MKETITLEANIRSVKGKQVNQLRTKGIVPGVVYGPTHTQPLAVQIPWSILRPVLRQAGGTSLIELKVDGESINVLARDVQRHATRGDVLHIDFYAVDVNATIRIHIPILLLDVEGASKRLGTKIFQPMNTIEVESLPGNIPEHIEIDLALLKNPGDHITVANIPAIPGVTFVADADALIAQAATFVSAAEEEEIAEEGPSDAGEVEVIKRRAKEEEEGEEN